MHGRDVAEFRSATTPHARKGDCLLRHTGVGQVRNDTCARQGLTATRFARLREHGEALAPMQVRSTQVQKQRLCTCYSPTCHSSVGLDVVTARSAKNVQFVARAG